MSERNLISRFLIEASKRGARMFRVNTGLGWVGNAQRFSKQEFVKVLAGDVLVRHARPLHAGLCEGGSDTIGWKPVLITQDMVGKTVAIITAVEFKYGSTLTTPTQQNFIDAINKDGGRAAVVHSVEDGLKVFE